MVRRSLEWVAGSIVVYVLAACASKADLDGMMEIATGGIASMIGGTNGSGAEGSDGQGAESSGAQGAGAMGSDGSGAMGEGATGGTSIIDPVPEAEAAEDGTRIVNLYWTTADGLKTPAGFYDKDLDVQCSFMLTTDGVSRCLPTVATAFMGPSYFLDENCTQRAMLAQKGSCPPAAGQEAFAGEGTCGASRIGRYAVGAKGSSYYSLSGDTCTAGPSLLETYDVYAVGAEIPPTTYVEGTLVQGDQ